VNGPVIRPDHIQFELANEGVASEPLALAAAAASAAARTASGSAAGGGAIAQNGATGSLATSLDQAERDLILDALRSGQGSRREAAERLGISQRTLRYKLARLREAGIDVPAA